MVIPAVWIDRQLSRLLGNLGHAVGEKPSAFIFGTLFFYLFLATGIQNMNDNFVGDVEWLFTPTHGRGWTEERVYKEYFERKIHSERRRRRSPRFDVDPNPLRDQMTRRDFTDDLASSWLGRPNRQKLARLSKLQTDHSSKWDIWGNSVYSNELEEAEEKEVRSGRGRRNVKEDLNEKEGIWAMVRVLFVAKEEGTMLRNDTLHEFLYVTNRLRSAKLESNGKEYTYEDICGNHCWDPREEIQNFIDLMPRYEAGEVNITYPAFLDPVTLKVMVLPAIFGGIEPSDDGAVVTYVKAAAVTQVIASKPKEIFELGYEWLLVAETEMNQVRKELKHLDIYFYSTRIATDQLERGFNAVFPFVTASIFILIGFSSLCLVTLDPVKSKPILAIMGVISAAIATLASMGFLIYIQVPFIGLIKVAPFLILVSQHALDEIALKTETEEKEGIGLDDSFVIVGAWRRTNPRNSVSDRMRATYAEAAVSVTITSLTDGISFLIGSLTDIPSIYIFCTYTGTAVVFLYFCHLTFFGGFLALVGYAEQANRHSITCFKVPAKSEARDRNSLFRACCAGGVSSKNPYHEDDVDEHLGMVIFRDYVGKLLTFPQIKVLVLIGYLGYLAVAIYGVTQLREGAVGEDKLALDMSTTGKYWQLNDKHFRKFSFGVDVMITETLDYSRNETQWKVEDLLKKMESLPHIAQSSYTNNWLRNFLSFIYTTGEFVDYDISDEEKFINTLKDTFLLDGAYGGEVIFNKAGTKIIATKYHLRTKDLQSMKDEVMVMVNLRAMADASDLNVTVHSGPFKFFDQVALRPLLFGKSERL
ncbi:unnamed protein product [Darwinula stevensoni]|uniref:SSD domain-containing protein n=1 Tax=Darwinula stevensoni TaxID=69355 RepID=A0A7R8XLG8_9CRUS|nr:unnamed protein product [Darwinula stevensoni]CAG0894221.1 unnamed protein product [Darwinula stevensoni]